jgi:DNA primase
MILTRLCFYVNVWRKAFSRFVRMAPDGAYNQIMDEVAEVKSRLEITEVVGAYVPLKQAGRNLKAPCPFHQEKTASFMVSPDKGIYHCFGCGEGGDIFNFVMKMEGVDFKQALEMLARKAGVELKARSGESKEAGRLRARLLEAHELAVRYFQANLVGNRKALEYVIKKRGLNNQTIRDFLIGYAPDTWEGLTAALTKKGFNAKEMLQGGLAGQKEGRSTVYDLFRGRVMFTICDREGRPVGFTGRVLDDSVPKYLNTPQTPLYDKSSVIFALHLAKEAIRQADEVVLVEGQMDVVASHQAGVRQVVATSGTAMTMEHLRTLSKLTKNIKLAFDADRAGLAATERAIEMGQKLGLTLRMVELPEGIKDADELIQKDVEAWRQAIAGAKYIVDYLFDRFEADFDLESAVGKRGYADRLAANLRRLGDPVEQDHYVKLLAGKTGTSEEAVRAKIAQTSDGGTGPATTGTPLSSPSSPGHRAAGSPPVVSPVASAVTRDQQPIRRAVVQTQGKPTARQKMEESLLGLTLNNMTARASLDDLTAVHFSSPERVLIFEQLKSKVGEPGEVVAAGLGELGTYAKQLMLIGENEFGDVDESALAFEAFSLAHNVMLRGNGDRKRQLGAQIQEAEGRGDQAEVGRLMQEFQDIIRTEV